MIVVKDAVHRRIVHANQAAEEFWGVSRTAAVGQTLAEIFPAGRADIIDRMDVEAIESGCSSAHDAHPSSATPGDGRLLASKRHCICGPDGKPQLLVTVTV